MSVRLRVGTTIADDFVQILSKKPSARTRSEHDRESEAQASESGFAMAFSKTWLTLRDQPCAEVLEAIVGAASIDEIGGPPELPAIRLGVDAIELPLVLQQLVRTQPPEDGSHPFDEDFIIRGAGASGRDELPECSLIHARPHRLRLP